MEVDKKADAGIADIVGAITDIIVVYPGGWGEDCPEWIRTNIPLARLLENIKALKEHRPVTGTDLEAMFYLSTTEGTCTWMQLLLEMQTGVMHPVIATPETVGRIIGRSKVRIIQQ